jgi:hypothetical protein
MGRFNLGYRVILADGTEHDGDGFTYTTGREGPNGPIDPGTLRYRDRPVGPPWKIQQLQPDGSWVTVCAMGAPDGE